MSEPMPAASLLYASSLAGCRTSSDHDADTLVSQDEALDLLLGFPFVPTRFCATLNGL
jgi:hypothetical protein